jgi:hypothetical protein
MKKSLILICLCSIVILQSCSPKAIAVSGKFSTVAPENEIVINPELREFLKKNPNPKVVLRVPSTTSNVTAAESEKNSNYNNLYGRIEKELMKEGYTVRDRNLLNNLLLSGQNLSYKEIGEKIETDIIIEIVSINENTVSTTNSKVEFEQDISQLNTNITIKNLFTAINYAVDCKIILVNEGTTVGMFTFNYCNCALPNYGACDTQIRTYKYGKKYYLYPTKYIGYVVSWPASEQWHTSVKHTLTTTILSELLARDLIKILRGKD